MRLRVAIKVARGCLTRRYSSQQLDAADRRLGLVSTRMARSESVSVRARGLALAGLLGPLSQAIRTVPVEGHRCERGACRKPLHPRLHAVYCSNACAAADA